MQLNNEESSGPAFDSQQVLKNLCRTLIVGFGNPDREDDGVAWHTLHRIADYFNIPVSADTDAGIFPAGESLDFWFNLQLMPEMAAEMVYYQRICFVDAHTGALDEEIHIEKLESKFQNSPLTHHMTAESIISILENVYHHLPEAILVSIRGYQFRFEQSLSARTKILSIQAAETIINWILTEKQVK